jgi:hypothetical protein
LTALHRRGALARRQIVPPRGGREFVYWVPQADVAQPSRPTTRSQRESRPATRRPVTSARSDASEVVGRRPRQGRGRRRTPA